MARLNRLDTFTVSSVEVIRLGKKGRCGIVQILFRHMGLLSLCCLCALSHHWVRLTLLATSAFWCRLWNAPTHCFHHLQLLPTYYSGWCITSKTKALNALVNYLPCVLLINFRISRFLLTQVRAPFSSYYAFKVSISLGPEVMGRHLMYHFSFSTTYSSNTRTRSKKWTWAAIKSGPACGSTSTQRLSYTHPNLHRWVVNDIPSSLPEAGCRI
jgi:hypothetical protein